MSESTPKTPNPASSKEVTRAYFDSLLVEERLMDSSVPTTEFELYGKKFETPIMTAALSHLGIFNPEMPSAMTMYAQGAAKAGAVHFIGMGSDEEFEEMAERIQEMTREMKCFMSYTGVKDVKSFDASVIHRL